MFGYICLGSEHVRIVDFVNRTNPTTKAYNVLLCDCFTRLLNNPDPALQTCCG